jgi:hypothetical protein
MKERPCNMLFIQCKGKFSLEYEIHKKDEMEIAGFQEEYQGEYFSMNHLFDIFVFTHHQKTALLREK